MISIKEIAKKNTYPIRHLVLRKGKTLESCYFDGDEIATTKHFGIEFENKLVGIVSVYEQKNNLFIEDKQFQIRGMAILDEFQKKGFGKSLIEKAETYCKESKSSLIWFNARENAVTFYEKLNYTILGKPFDIKDVGLHYIMHKKLN